MPIKQPQKITSWSYSRLSTYEQCPRKAKYLYIEKKKEPGSPAMERGSEIHKMAEKFVSGTLAKLPVELKAYAAEFKDLKKQNAACEDQWAFNEHWFPTEWFGKDAWCRTVLDIWFVKKDVLVLIDLKTGKIRDGYEDQLSLYALAGFSHEPNIKEVHAQLWYLDQGETKDHVFKLADVPKLKKDWKKRVTPMLNDVNYAPRPSGLCRWCHFSQAKQGPCEY